MPELETNIKKLQDELAQLKAGTTPPITTDSTEDTNPLQIEQAQDVFT